VRGYFGIGVYRPKTEVNIGTLWRSAYLYQADFIFTIGHRYKYQASDTMKTARHIPLWNFETYEEFQIHLPDEAQIVCIELHEQAKLLPEAYHPQCAVYLLGAEDDGLPEDILRGKQKIQIPTSMPFSLNVAVAGTLVMYDRFVKMAKGA
jgi:tRNA(Leu) C34 or U34 (ribose-2'-O)-methylase TrmL